MRNVMNGTPLVPNLTLSPLVLAEVDDRCSPLPSPTSIPSPRTQRAMFNLQKDKMQMKEEGKKRTASDTLAKGLGQERYSRSQPLSEMKHCYAMVGLPARGKSYIAQKLCRYLNWVGIKSKVFNVGEYRREMIGASMEPDYYDPSNEEGYKSRCKIAEYALSELICWLLDEEDACVGILDATNTTKARRSMIIKQCEQDNINVMFIESVLEDEAIEADTIRSHKIRCPDYKGYTQEDAFQDFSRRIDNYKKAYESLSLSVDRELSFIRILNISQFHVNNIRSNAQSRSAYFLMNMRVNGNSLYFTRHGESEYNSQGLIGGDSCLTDNGIKYGKALGQFVTDNSLEHLTVWTSHMKRTIQTSSYLPNINIDRWKPLNEIDAGMCDGLTYEEIEERHPEEFALRDLDKFRYRYPRGESYSDLCHRLESVIMELERQSDVLVVCHQAVLRCIVGYFMNINEKEIPYIKIPLHTVVKLTPVAYGCEMEEIPFHIEASLTHRERPSVESIEERLVKAGFEGDAISIISNQSQ